MNSLTRFWTGQEVYIMKVFLPIILGFLVIFIGLLVVSALSFWWRHYRLWHLGKEENRSDHGATRLKTLLAVTFGHLRFWKELYPGAMHFSIFWGAILIFMGKIVRLFSYPVGLTNPPQNIFKYASCVSEIGGLLVIVGGCLAVYRRYVVKPPRLETKPTNTLIYLWGAVLLMTGYFVKGYRIALIGGSAVPDWLSWAPVSYLISRFFLILPTQPLNELLVWHRVLIHALPAFLFFAYVFMTHTPLQHFFLSPINIFFRSLKPKGALNPILNFEESETFGVRKIFDFTWKQLLDLEACTICGRCQENCPATISGKPLNPKKVIQDLRTSLQPFSHNDLPLVSSLVSEAEFWACTTCRACMEVCPVFVEHVDKIIEMRRDSVLTESKFPSEYKQVFKNLEIFGDTMGKGKLIREDWASNLRIKRIYQHDNIEVLFWVGCMSAIYDERSKNIPVAAAKVLEKAGLDFGILGKEELCCGDLARRMGNEYLFQQLAKQNIEVFKKYKIKKVVTHCPHCFNTLKNEYTQFGADIEVLHFTELIEKLFNEGKLKIRSKIDDVFTYHDPCYLGRYNSIYQEPRKILKSFLDVNIIEMDRLKDKSFCCGAGGGNIWYGISTGSRMEGLRIEEAVKTKAQGIITACPFCEIMFDSAVKQKGIECSFRVMDILEIVNQVT